MHKYYVDEIGVSIIYLFTVQQYHRPSHDHVGTILQYLWDEIMLNLFTTYELTTRSSPHESDPDLAYSQKISQKTKSLESTYSSVSWSYLRSVHVTYLNRK